MVSRTYQRHWEEGASATLGCLMVRNGCRRCTSGRVMVRIGDWITCWVLIGHELGAEMPSDGPWATIERSPVYYASSRVCAPQCTSNRHYSHHIRLSHHIPCDITHAILPVIARTSAIDLGLPLLLPSGTCTSVPVPPSVWQHCCPMHWDTPTDTTRQFHHSHVISVIPLLTWGTCSQTCAWNTL